MKIGMICWNLFPKGGGDATTSMHLARALVKKGVEVEIFAPTTDRSSSYQEKSGVIVNRISGAYATGYDSVISKVLFLFSMAKAVKSASSRIDLLHAHDFHISTSVAVFSGKHPVISVYAADPVFEFINFKKKNLIPWERLRVSRNPYVISIKKILGFINNNVDCIVSLNSSLNSVIEKHKPKKIVNIPCGIDIDMFTRKSLKIKEIPSKKYILVVSRFVCWKNIDGAIRIYKNVKKEFNDLELVIIARGPLDKFYADKIKDIPGISIFSGLTYEKIIEFYKNASAFLCPTFYETFGIVLLEAMAARVPIVASNLEVFNDRIIDGKTGFTADPADEQLFTAKILDILENKVSVKSVTENAFTLVKEYNADIIAEKYIELYKELMERQPDDRNNIGLRYSISDNG